MNLYSNFNNSEMFEVTAVHIKCDCTFCEKKVIKKKMVRNISDFDYFLS